MGVAVPGVVPAFAGEGAEVKFRPGQRVMIVEPRANGVRDRKLTAIGSNLTGMQTYIRRVKDDDMYELTLKVGTATIEISGVALAPVDEGCSKFLIGVLMKALHGRA